EVARHGGLAGGEAPGQPDPEHSYLGKALTTWPAFMTQSIRDRTETSFKGSPWTATMSAKEPFSMTPARPCHPSSSAATVVALRIASIGVMPRRTSCSNSWAWLISVHGKPPASVPKAILTPALRQLATDFAWILGSSPQIAHPARARGPATYAATVSVGERKIPLRAISWAASGRIESPC